MTLNGKWVAVDAELGGNAMPGSVVSSIFLTISNDTYTARVAGVTDKGTLTFNTDLQPHTIDILGTDGPNKNKTIKAIYRLVSNHLHICYDLSGNDYPEEFVSRTHPQHFLVTYRRQNAT